MEYIKLGLITPSMEGYRAANRAKNIPKGFIAFFLKTKKWYQCNKHSADGKRCLVQISADRFDKLSPEQKQTILTHAHQFPLDTIQQHVEPSCTKPEVLEHINSLNSLQRSIIVYTGKTKTSINSISSKEFLLMIHEAIKYGQRYPRKEPFDILSLISRKSFTNSFITAAKYIKLKQIENFKNFQYVALCIDAGTLNKVSYMDIMIANSNSPLKPIPFKSIPHFQGTKKAYRQALNKAIKSVSKNGLILSGIVADNLKVQWSALNEILSEKKSLVAFACACHSLNLSLLDFKTNCGRIAESISNLEAFAHIFSSKPVTSRFGKVCPRFCPTRWTIYVDITSCIIQHAEEIADVVMKHLYQLDYVKDNIEIITDTLFRDAPLIHSILWPFKALSEKLESDHTSITDIYGFMFSSFHIAHSFLNCNDELHELLNELIQFIKNRLEKTKSGLMQYTLFLLTKEGRKFYHLLKTDPVAFIECISSNYNINTDRFIDIAKKGLYIYIEQKLFDAEENILTPEMFYDTVKTSASEIETKEQEQPNGNAQRDTNGEEFHNEENAEEEDDIRICEAEEDVYEEDDTDIYEAEEDVYEEDDTDIYEAEEDFDDNGASMTEVEEYYETDMMGYEEPLDENEVLNLINELGKHCGLNPNTVREQFLQWMTDSQYEDLSAFSSSYVFWKYFENNSHLNNLAKIFLYYGAIPASEASCERFFSQQRRVITGEYSRSSPKLAKAKVILNSLNDQAIEHLLSP